MYLLLIKLPYKRCIVDTIRDFVLIYLYLISEGNEIVRACDRHSNKAVTLGKHVTKYEHMRKWIVEFLRKYESSDDKIARVTQFASPNLSIYFNFVLVLGSVAMLTCIN